ncbi:MULTISPECIES: hypothetical protein [unclassified Bacteroides]|uniref:hypothetical protein n=1 Tax=unclassified Bacteroides TaxID=2646097 RepID=UPI00159518F7|nr:MULTISPECIES: hypothetical protein [unclassified Bacteroides]MDR3823052.1 hypothetical protein [Bacteroides sp.]NVK91926.1 hypothetical protein [Bacteroides sp. L10-4]
MDIAIIDSLTMIKDTVMTVVPQQMPQEPYSLMGILDVVYKIAMILIAAFNAWFAYTIHKLKNKKEDDFKEADRKIALLKTLILDYNLKFVYEFFDNLEAHLSGLNERKADKRAIESHIQADFKRLNEKFVNLLSAVDRKLYDKILDISDSCRDKLVTNIGNEGVNLYVEAQYKNLIKKPYDDIKRTILSELFGYKGM